MRSIPCVLLAASMAIPIRAEVLTELSPAQIKEAIAAPEKAASCYRLTKGRFAMEVFADCFTTPFSRVVGAAREAKRKYKPFSEADVTPELIAAGELQIHGLAGPAARGGVASVDTIVVMPEGSKDRSKAVMPTKTTEVSAEYKNALGASYEGKSVTAVFPLSVLTERNTVHSVFDKHRAASGAGAAGCDDCDIEFKLKNVR
jgi:hypothetical protein